MIPLRRICFVKSTYLLLSSMAERMVTHHYIRLSASLHAIICIQIYLTGTVPK